MASTRIPDAVKRVFMDTFTARDVAEPLASFDAAAASREIHDFMTARDFDVVGIRSQGHVVGYVKKDTLHGGDCGQHQRPLSEATVMSDIVPLLSILMELNRAPFLFVTVFGRVVGIITPADLQKPPVRMWLFGIVTMIEIRCTELIERHCPTDTWKMFVSEARLHKAQILLDERRRRNQSLQLFDCLQFSDKGQIIARNEEIRKCTIFSSRRQAEEAVKKLEQLRNNLAHAQDIMISDWETILQLCEFITQQEEARAKCDAYRAEARSVVMWFKSSKVGFPRGYDSARIRPMNVLLPKAGSSSLNAVSKSHGRQIAP